MDKVTTKKKKTAVISVRKRIRRHVKLAIVPHKDNQYRPHAIRRYGIAIILVAILLLQGVYNSMTSGSVLGIEADITTNGLLTATNKARADNGEEPLQLNEELTQAATLKVSDMFSKQYWAHTSPDGTTPWYWFSKTGYAYSDAGENLAENFTTSESVVSAWLQSPTHRANLLKAAYRDVGFATMTGTLNGQKVSIVVSLYGTPAEATSVQGASVNNTVSSSTNQPLSLVARFGLGLQSLTPAAIGSIVLLLVAANIAIAAHLYRKKLPPNLRKSWYRHHGLYKAIGFFSLAIFILFAYGSTGQI